MARAPVPPYRAQLATLVAAPPAGEGWVHETKYDGYRIGCALEGGRATLWSRRGNDWTAQFPEVARAAEALPARSALLDGEVAAVLPGGRTSFQALQQAFSGGRRSLAYFVFDLLWLDGEDLSRRPLLERKDALRRLLGARGEVLRYAPHVDAPGAEVLREACRLGLEGIVSKRADAPYRPGRNATWTKAKCLARQELVIGGFTDPEGSRQGIGALLVGFHEGGALRFAGKVGTGFTQASARALRARLDRLERADPPFTPRPPGPLGRIAHWVRPELVAEVAFTEWTGDGKVRHPSFQGLREDKRAAEVVREAPAAAAPPAAAASAPASPTAARDPARRRARPGSAAGEVIVGGVRLSHAERVVFPGEGRAALTKADVARYYDAVADAMVPHLRGRPLTLFHCPQGLSGECRFMKHSKTWAPPAVRRVRIQEKTKLGEYLVADDRAALLSLVQLDVVELHTWNSTAEALEEPDRLVLDLDPGPAVPWPEVVRAARLLRSALEALGLAAFVKTTGGAGLHVVTPLVPRRRWEDCLAFARGLAAAVARHEPRAFTVAFARAGRERKILLDYLRNNRTNTSVAAFSLRARPGAPASVPVAWDELGPRLRPERLGARTVPRRLARLGADPWAGYARAARPLTDAHLAAVGAAPAGEPARGGGRR
ncbi:DNA ligase D [Anaeromyxobacter sp. Red801]|uniref:DNA ligase D n=1 Tax=Anaeromyxobacter sp. Red801 TaxID=3411632 RepID=UPI003B9F2C8F